MFASQRYIRIVLLSSIASSFIFFALQQEWFLWRGPISNISSPLSHHTYKEIDLYYWKHGQLQHETIRALWLENRQQNIHYVINSWLTFLYDEECMQQTVIAETSILSPSESELFISFDRKPFKKTAPIIHKIQFIQALCATIAPLYSIQKIHFLVKHEPLHDPHIDCDIAWPITIA